MDSSTKKLREHRVQKEDADCIFWRRDWRSYGSFRKQGVPYSGVLIIRILPLRVLYWGPLFSETPLSTEFFPAGLSA